MGADDGFLLRREKMSTFSTHENCPDCGEVESIKLTPMGKYARLWCEECGYEREEDLVLWLKSHLPGPPR